MRENNHLMKNDDFDDFSSTILMKNVAIFV